MARCIKLEWAQTPQIYPCAVGEPADFRGLKIYAVYDNGTRDTVDVTFKMFNESDLQVSGRERKSMVTFAGQKLPVTVPLINAYLDHIEVAAKEGLKCREGEVLDRNYVVVTAFYSNGTCREVTNYKVFPFAPLTIADKEISIRYGRSKAVLEVSVVPASAPVEPASNPSEKAQEPVSANQQEPAPVQDKQIPLKPKKTNSPGGFIPGMPMPSGEEQQPSEPKKTDPAAFAAPGKTVKGVSVAKAPNHQKYLVGDTVADLTGGKLDLIYSDGSVGQIDMMADGDIFIESQKPGRGLVSFECFGKPVSFPVEILTPQITKLVISKMPAKLEYIDGEPLDLTGLVLEATYNDRSHRMIRGLQSNGFIVTMAHADEGVTLGFEGSSFTIPVKVEKEKAPVVPVGVSFRTRPKKLEYAENECLYPDLAGADLLVQMSDGRREIVPVDQSMVREFDISKPGRTILKISYLGFDLVCFINVKQRVLEKLVVDSGPKKTSYINNEKFDLQGVILYAVYSNGEKEVVSDYEVQNTFASTEDKAIHFRYKGLSVDFPVTVEALQIVSMDWAQMPTKTTYYTHEQEFSCDGGVLRIQRNDGVTEEVSLTKDMVSGFKPDVAGLMPLRISYAGHTIPLAVTVLDRILLGLKVVKQPRVEYVEGETFDPQGLVVEALYTGGTSEEVAVNYLPYGALHEDSSTVMLIYQDKAAVLPIRVVKPATPEHRPIVPSPVMPSFTEEAREDKAPAPVTEEPCAEPQTVAAEPASPALDDRSSELVSDASDLSDSPVEPVEPPKPLKPVPDFYPSSFCIRFETEPEDYAF